MSKRLLLIAIMLIAAAPAWSIDTRRGGRIAILDTPLPESSTRDYYAAVQVSEVLAGSLATRGFDSFMTHLTFDEMLRDHAVAADYYIEIVPGDGYIYSGGEAGVAAGRVSASARLVITHVAVEFRIYDGRTMQCIAREPMYRDIVSVVPTGVGMSIHRVSVSLGLPLLEFVRYRRAIRDIADGAIARIADVSGIQR